jgi:hypothetical protein
LAWLSVKLLRPATGALELFCPGLFTALLFGPDCAGCCADAAVAAIKPAHMRRSERFIGLSPKVYGRS